MARSPRLVASLAGTPTALAAARQLLGPMPKVHLETAIAQFSGTIALVTDVIDAALREAPECGDDIAAVRPAALDALAGHRTWLSARLSEGAADGGFADPRIGAELFARKLSLTLNTQADADAILARAHADLDRVSQEIAALAAEIVGRGSRGGGPGPGGGRERSGRPGRSSASWPPRRPTTRTSCRSAAARSPHRPPSSGRTGWSRCSTTRVEVIEMPEIDRGIAVAYCDSPGPLETAPMPTFIAISPTPADWPAQRVASFYREYNRHMLHNLMVHEAMPGHYLQLQHSRRFSGSATAIRAALRSGSFVEGWAVYAEQVMAEHGYPGEGDPRAVRMQQLKMQLRMIINAILDARVHGHGMTEAEAMALMTGRGYQEEGEAAGKWRRVLLTSAQLSTYYVGFTEVADLAGELRAVKPDAAEAEIHDRMLAHGSPPVRLLRSLLTS